MSANIRQVFTEAEKSCLAHLILKYKLNYKSRLVNCHTRKLVWGRLTKEYNADERNTKRTVVQLRKCWDNMKTRRRQALDSEKERIKKEGEVPIPSGSQEMGIVEALPFVSDSETFAESLALPPRSKSASVTSEYDAPSEATAPDYIAPQVYTEEFNVRKKNYFSVHERDEQLHKLKVAEREWLVKAAEQQYHKACLERESAEELLMSTRLKRKEAELKLEILRNIEMND